MDMENEYGLSGVSDADLRQERDFIQKLIYETAYQSDDKVQVYFEDFTSALGFEPLGRPLDTLRIEQIIKRLYPYGIFGLKSYPKLDKGFYIFSLDGEKIKDFLHKIESVLEAKRNTFSVTLTIEDSRGLVQKYVQNNLIVKQEFYKNDNEYRVLHRLALSPNQIVSVEDLIKELKTARSGSDFANQKQRVYDKIKALKRKLGDDIISKSQAGYLLQCNVSFK